MNKSRALKTQPSRCAQYIRGRCSGFSLIEVLVAFFILSIGLLGMAGLQMKGLKTNNLTFIRSQAAVLAYDMADRVRTNRIAVQKKIISSTVQGQIMVDCTTPAGCSGEAMFKHDLAQWQQRINQAIPGGQGGVCIDSTPNDGTKNDLQCDGSGNVYVVKVLWPEQYDDEVKETRFTLSFIP